MVAKEIARVEEAGGWVADGRVCDVIAVSRAFGDIQFKEAQGRKDMLDQGVECVAPVALIILYQHHSLSSSFHEPCAARHTADTSLPLA